MKTDCELKVFEDKMTQILRYRTLLALAIFGSCASILAGLIWAYVLYYSKLPQYESKVVTATLIAMIALTGAFLVMARFARKRLMAIGSTSQDA